MASKLIWPPHLSSVANHSNVSLCGSAEGQLDSSAVIIVTRYLKNCYQCNRVKLYILIRGVSGGWAGWAIVHPVFGRIVMRRQQWRQAALLHAHPDLGT